MLSSFFMTRVDIERYKKKNNYYFPYGKRIVQLVQCELKEIKNLFKEYRKEKKKKEKEKKKKKKGKKKKKKTVQ